MITGLIVGVMLCLLRVSAFVTFLPAPGGKTIPGTVKVGLAVAMTGCLAPDYAIQFMPTAASWTGGVDWLMLIVLAAKEVIYGTALAWMLGLCMVPVSIAGAFIAQEMGLTMGGLTSPQDQLPSNVISSALEAIAGIAFFSFNLHHIAFSAIGMSFQRGPAGNAALLPSFGDLMSQISRVQHSGLVIAAPIAIILFLFLITLLVTVRSAPQFQFFTLGMPMRVAVGAVGLMLFLPQLTSAMMVYMKQISSFGVF